MNGTGKILSLFIVMAFLLSTGGIFYVKHTCLHSGETSVFLGEKHDCCENTLDINSCCEQHTDKNTCPVHGEHENCCVNDIVYLKGDSEYQKSETRILNYGSDYQLYETLLSHNNAYIERPTPYLNVLPPYKPPGEVLRKKNILIL